MSITMNNKPRQKKSVTFHKRSSFMNLFMYQASAVDTHLNNNWIIYPELFMNGKLSKQNTVNSGDMFPGLSEEYILAVYEIFTHYLTMLVLPWFQVFFVLCQKDLFQARPVDKRAEEVGHSTRNAYLEYLE